MKISEQDLQLTFTVINNLNSGFQSSYAALRFLRELNSTAITENHFTYPATVLGKINSWIGDLSNKKPLLQVTWRLPETVEAKEAFRAMEALRQDLLNWKKEIVRILSQPQAQLAPEDLRILISQLARCSYAQGYYVRGIAFLGKALGNQAIVDGVTAVIPVAEAEINIAHALVGEFKEKQGQLSSESLNDLWRRSQDTPIRFSTIAHDLTLLLSTYDNGFTYERAGIPEEEAGRWASRGFQPIPASFWRANGFTPEVAEEWRNAGFTEAPIARGWYLAQIPPADALRWFMAEVVPLDAKERAAKGEAPPPLPEAPAPHQEPQPQALPTPEAAAAPTTSPGPMDDMWSVPGVVTEPPTQSTVEPMGSEPPLTAAISAATPPGFFGPEPSEKTGENPLYQGVQPQQEPADDFWQAPKEQRPSGSQQVTTGKKINVKK